MVRLRPRLYLRCLHFFRRPGRPSFRRHSFRLGCTAAKPPPWVGHRLPWTAVSISRTLSLTAIYHRAEVATTMGSFIPRRLVIVLHRPYVYRRTHAARHRRIHLCFALARRAPSRYTARRQLSSCVPCGSHTGRRLILRICRAILAHLLGVRISHRTTVCRHHSVPLPPRKSLGFTRQLCPAYAVSQKRPPVVRTTL